MIPGEYFLADEDIIANEGREVTHITVKNTGDRPIQVGSHYHFYEANEALEFEREEAFGKRLNVPAGAAVRFEPGDQKTIELVCYAGERRVYGFHNAVEGSVEKGCKNK
ncbi:urease subunit beta [Neobacillus notoginsengisoli]|uniref:Urease subunit beta n=1 Tax=Neobacillus notoginsengisoli TaxID=1578198 RepID=A0A417YT15_9BACI|nr:urease subunit beta [Neobacillus notoginsengisoli]RHW39086.1 urease subunit beta [Neobacillus notoginsengisoli]